jgi:RNA polymerase sigma-70 factor, ECF subfamily
MNTGNAWPLNLETREALPEEDRMLVAAAQKDTAAARLFDKYYAEIFRYLRHSTQNQTLAEELSSNVFFSAFGHLALFRWRRVPFRAWLYRIATNEVRMHYRRQKRALAARDGPLDFGHAGDAPGADDALVSREERRLLRRALIELDQKYRTVIVLRYFEDKTLAEICEITNKREGTVKSQLHRGLIRLKEALVRMGVTFPPP